MATSFTTARQQQQIALDKMPVINLTQRAPVSGSQSVVSVSNGGGDNAGDEGVGADKNYRKVVPRPDDEPSVFCVVIKKFKMGF